MGDRWRAVAALVDRSRRALYTYVRRQDHPVSREEAAHAERVSRHLAAFHLDKLVEAGLLRASYEAPPDRPRGRGRAPKVYRPTDEDLDLTVPERQYRLLAEILADAAAADPRHTGDVRRYAGTRGRELGTCLRERGATDPATALDGLGFDPRTGPDGRVVLRNCPFRALASRHTDLVCGLNRAFIDGLLGGLAATQLRARLAPRPPACCVELTPAT
jgi:predicted ArsR family transcriptional regulator